MAEKPSAPLSGTLLARKGAATAEGFALRSIPSHRWRIVAFAMMIAASVGAMAFVGAALIYGGSLAPGAEPRHAAEIRPFPPTAIDETEHDPAPPPESLFAAEPSDGGPGNAAPASLDPHDAVVGGRTPPPRQLATYAAAPETAAQSRTPPSGETPALGVPDGAIAAAAPPPKAPAPRKIATATPPAASTPPKPKKRPRRVAAADYRVQLHALASDAAVRREWRRLRRQHGDLLSGLKLTVAPKRLGAGKKTVYRMQLGALSSRAQASALCARLRREKMSCMVVR